MCQRYSWIEKGGKVIFLTADDVFKTKRGRALQKWDTCRDDRHGHGAIRWYYNFTGGIDKECTDFSTPKNFPSELQEAIVTGKMWGFGIDEHVERLLLAPALKRYKEVKALAWKKYLEAEAPAWKKYNKVQASAWKKYNEVKATSLKEYEEIEPPAWKKYKKVKATAMKEYEKVEATAWKKYEEVQAPAWKNLWSDPKNRRANWRKIQGKE